MQPCAIHTPPANLGDFVAEIRPGFEALYGPDAAALYGRQAQGHLAATIAHPAVHAYGLMDGPEARALAMVRATDSRYLIAFFHALDGFAGHCGAQALLAFICEDLLRQEDRPIFTEYLPFCPLELDTAYVKLGFDRVDRQIMRHSAPPSPATAPEGFILRPASPDELLKLAGVLEAAYRAHRERFLFEEVESIDAAHAFLTQSAAGRYGACPDDFIIGAWHGEGCAGFAIGAEVVAGTGFVLHMAVLPEHRGRGLGRALLCALLSRFRSAGLPAAALGVTCANPAARLYARAGFETARPFPVYYRDPAEVARGAEF